MPDRLVLARARAGGDDAIADLYRQHAGPAMRYAMALCSNAADAEDLVADSFTRVIAQLRAGRGPDSSFRAYLFTTMRHRLYSANRREFAVDDVAVLDQAVASSSDDSESHANTDLLRYAFTTLSGTEQEILLLLDVLELRPAEVGSRLGLRPSAVSMRASRARGSLAEAFLVAHTRPSSDANCERFRPSYGRYVRGTLSAGRARQVRVHLDGCETCPALVAELSDINRGLRAIPIFAALPVSHAASGWQLGRVGAHARRGLRSATGHGHAGFGFGSVAAKIGVGVAALGVATSSAAVLVAHHSSQPSRPTHTTHLEQTAHDTRMGPSPSAPPPPSPTGTTPSAAAKNVPPAASTSAAPPTPTTIAPATRQRAMSSPQRSRRPGSSAPTLRPTRSASSASHPPPSPTPSRTAPSTPTPKPSATPSPSGSGWHHHCGPLHPHCWPWHH